MKILPINNTQSNKQTQFKAKFPQKDVHEFLREIENNDIDILPQLYTMLSFIKNNPGKNAEIKHMGLWHQIMIDGKSANGIKKYFAAFHALRDATVNSKDVVVKKSTVKKMTEEDFETAYYKNREKTIQDIENLFEA